MRAGKGCSAIDLYHFSEVDILWHYPFPSRRLNCLLTCEMAHLAVCRTCRRWTAGRRWAARRPSGGGPAWRSSSSWRSRPRTGGRPSVWRAARTRRAARRRRSRPPCTWPAATRPWSPSSGATPSSCERSALFARPRPPLLVPFAKRLSTR